jgi:HAD superfamily hydrolase (TIGR01509 family)
MKGRVTSGRREAAGFTQLDWVRARFLDALGIDPYPGTLNLIINRDDDVKAWDALRSSPGFAIAPPEGTTFCPGRCYAVRVNDQLPAGIVVPEVPGYPEWQVEIVAALSIRDTLSLADGDVVTIDPWEPCAVRAVIFDVDGTLVDSLTAYRIVAERAAAPYGVMITDAMIREALNTTRHFWDIALPADFADRDRTMGVLRRDAARLWSDVLREHGRVRVDIAPVLRTLRDRGVKLGIMTASRRGSLDALRQSGILDLFDAIVTGEDVGRRKPDPEGLLMCAAGLDVPPREAAYVGDTPLDVRAARAAGMFSIAVLSGAGDSALLSAAGADRLIPSVACLGDSSLIVI